MQHWTSERSLWAELAAVIVAYILIVFVLCPGNPVIGFPVHHDDFSNLASDLNSFRTAWAGHLPPRPVSGFGLTVLSIAGIPAYYLSLHVLVVMYALFSLRLLRRLLDARRMPLFFGVLVAAGALSLECVVEYSKYTGLITNLLSGVFAVAAMSLMAGQQQRVQGGSLLPRRAIVAIWSLSALSFWAKEDFILPAILLAVYLAFEAWQSTPAAQRAQIVRWLVLAAGMILLGVLLAAYNRSVQSGFTQATAGPYKPDFSASSVFHTAFAYLTMSPVASAAAILQASMLIWNLIAPAPVRWSRLVLVQALIALLALPYCVLPHHTALYYDFNWTVWQIGGALILLWNLSDRPAVRWAVAVLAMVCIAIGQPGRSSIAQWYANAERVNRNVVATLRANAESLRPHRVVVIEGAPFLGPWFASDGRFLRLRYGLDHEWTVRVRKESEYLRTLVGLIGTPVQGRVRTVAMEEEGLPEGVPVLRLSPDGTGLLDLKRGALKDSDRVRITKLHPDATAVGVRFQVQPDGQSAIALDGSNFMPGAMLLFDGRELKTAYGNSGFISANVPDDLISRAGVIQVSVRNPDGETSNGMNFHVASKASRR